MDAWRITKQPCSDDRCLASVILLADPERAPLPLIFAALTQQTVPRQCFEVLLCPLTDPLDVSLLHHVTVPDLAWRLIERNDASYSDQLNAAVQHARGEILIFLGPGISPSATFLADHLAYHQEHPGQRVVLGRVLDDAAMPATPFSRYLDQAGSHASAETLEEGDTDLPPWCCDLSNLSMPRHTMLAAGQFRMSALDLPPGFLPELDLGFRLVLSGATLVSGQRARATRHFLCDLKLACQQRIRLGALNVLVSRQYPDLYPLIDLMDDAHAFFLPFTSKDLATWQRMIQRLEQIPERDQPHIERQDPVGGRSSRRALYWFYDRLLHYYQGQGIHLALCSIEGPQWIDRFLDSTGILDITSVTVPRAMKDTAQASFSAGSPILLSVIIPVRNGEKTLPATLASFGQQTLPPERLEIVVVDDGSTDGTLPLLERYQALWPLQICSQQAAGQSAATNRGIERARGEYVLLSAADIIAAPDLLEQHLRSHRSTTYDISVLGYLPYAPDLQVSPFMRFITSDGTQFGYNLIPLRDNLSPKFAYAPNISVRRHTVHQVGLFDESFVFGMQDIDLGVRLKQAGVVMVLNERAIGFHNHPVELSYFTQYRQVMAGRGSVIFAQKWPDLCPLPMLKASCYHHYWLWHDRTDLLEQALSLIQQLEQLEEGQRPLVVEHALRHKTITPALSYLYTWILQYYFQKGVFQGLCQSEGASWIDTFLHYGRQTVPIFPAKEVEKLQQLLSRLGQVMDHGKPFDALLLVKQGKTKTELHYCPDHYQSLVRNEFNLLENAPRPANNQMMWG